MKRSIRKNVTIAAAVAVFAVLLSDSCSMRHKMTEIREKEMNVKLSLPPDMEIQLREIDTMKQETSDTIVVNFEGRDMLIMKAVKDEETGQMIANEELKAAVVTARFRNVAERHGKVDIEFEVLVPAKIQDTDWQLRFCPSMWILQDTIDLEKVYVTGANYRKTQLRGYELYNKFLSKIISDSTMFIDIRNFELWLSRHLPQIYAFRSDSSYVNRETFVSCFGVTERDAVYHYTLGCKIRSNDRRLARKGKVFDRYVKAPIETEDIRIDTVLVPGSGDFIYRYVETIKTRPKLRKVEIIVDGNIYRQDELIYDMPPTEPLTYYISSLSTLVDPTTRYCTQVLYRRAEASASWNIDFAVSQSDIDLRLSDNAKQMANIAENIDELLINRKYDLDSITITAFASPEGAVNTNAELCRRRGASVADHFNCYIKRITDSLRREAGMVITVDDDMSDSGMKGAVLDIPDVRFKVLSGGENWSVLDEMVEEDSVLTQEEKNEYKAVRERYTSLDECEKALSVKKFYAHLKNDLYPGLRSVKFDFALHRRGMIKDTVHTTMVDTVYMNGVQAIRDRDYETAVSLLGPYRDYNLAIAYVSLDRNASAMEILEDLPQTPQVKYMLALLHSREGDDASAVRLYVEACSEDPSFIHRGNLDPEISALIKRYGLNNEPDTADFNH